ncbi:MAG: redox-regulated ATPase YchF [Candidatus Portnoybacteria bacterium]|nr:redox-regulated ATPase YchF [Candidatus Portnoybacteria bacterium]
MSFSIGIIGLPNVGKSTLFKALTQQEVDISNYPFCTIDPNIGIVQVPDQRLKKISELIQPKKTTPTAIEFVDIAGLVKKAHKGEGLGNQFLAHIREVNAVIHVIRSFKDKDIKHIEDTLDIQRDIEITETELIMKDIETLEKHLNKIEGDIKARDKQALKEKQLIEKLQQHLNQGKPISDTTLTGEEIKIIKHLSLLTIKPMIYLINSKGTDDELEAIKALPQNTIPLDLKLELEMSELSEQEKQELNLESRLDVLIKTCYKILNLITFYTIKGGEETRAWTAEENTKAPEAGGIVHTDFQEKFIRAEVINYKDLIQSKTWKQAKTEGKIRTEGKEYTIKDGDILEFKI